MELKLIRTSTNKVSTTGKLYVDGKLFCHTLEETAKILKEGEYKWNISWSPKFKKLTPRLLNTGKRSGILIHSGNTIADTEGCILVGVKLRPNRVDLSRKTFRDLMEKLISGYYQDDSCIIKITYENNIIQS